MQKLIALLWDAAKGISFSEEAGNRAEKFGRVLSKKEIEGMREVCRVSTARGRCRQVGADAFARSSAARCWILRRRRSDLESQRSRLTRLCTTRASSGTLTPVLWVTESSLAACARTSLPSTAVVLAPIDLLQICERGYLPWCVAFASSATSWN